MGSKGGQISPLMHVPLYLSQLTFVYGTQKNRLTHWDGSFEYQQHMFWLRNRKINSIKALVSRELLINYTQNQYLKLMYNYPARLILNIWFDH